MPFSTSLSNLFQGPQVSAEQNPQFASAIGQLFGKRPDPATVFIDSMLTRAKQDREAQAQNKLFKQLGIEPPTSNPVGDLFLGKQSHPLDALKTYASIQNQQENSAFQDIYKTQLIQSQIDRNKADAESFSAKQQSADELYASIGEGVMNGTQPPIFTGMYGKGAGVRKYLADQGFDLAKAQRDWTSTTALAKNLNSPQQVRLGQALGSVDYGIEPLRQLSGDLERTGFVPANKLVISARLNGVGVDTKGLTPEQVQVATKYVTQMNLMRDELAQGFSGGYAPTEPAFKLADEILNPAYGSGQLSAALDQVKVNLNIRRNAIASVQPVFIGGGMQQYLPQPQTQGNINQYLPQGQAPSPSVDKQAILAELKRRKQNGI